MPKLFPEFSPRQDLTFVVGDLFTTEMRLSRYEAAEINKINNIFAGSFMSITREETSTSTDTMQMDNESSSEVSSSSSSTAEEMMRESSNSALSRDQNLNVGGTIKGTAVGVQFTAYGDYNSSSSSSSSRQSATERAKSVVNESAQTTSERVTHMRRTQNTNTKRELFEAGFDNRGGGHVAGVLRNINEVHCVTLLNYSKHLYTNLIIADPAAHYLSFLEHQKTSPPAPDAPQASVIDDTGTLVQAKDITRSNWRDLAAQYSIEGVGPPEEMISVSGLAEFKSPVAGETGHASSKTSVTIPEGYRPLHMIFTSSGVVNDGSLAGGLIHTGGFASSISMSGGINKLDFSGTAGSTPVEWHEMTAGKGGTIVVGLTVWHTYTALVSFDIQCECLVTATLYHNWQLATYNTLLQAARDQFNPDPMSGVMGNVGITSMDYTNNPTMARAMILRSIKAATICQVLGTDLEGFDVIVSNGPDWPAMPTVDIAKLEALTPLIQFLESLFDFDKMTVDYISGYIGTEDKRARLFDDATPAPMRDFLAASFANVTLPIRRFGENEHRLRWFMETGEIFVGEDVPIFDDDISLAIVNELDGTEALSRDEAIEIDTWEIKLPTVHSMLQSDAILPDFDDLTANSPLVTDVTPVRGPDDGG